MDNDTAIQEILRARKMLTDAQVILRKVSYPIVADLSSVIRGVDDNLAEKLLMRELDSEKYK